MTDAKSRELLEFPAVVARLASMTAFGPSRRLAEALEPSSDSVVVERMLDETDEARAFAGERPDVGVGGARDIGRWIERAARGGRLAPSDLLEVLDTLVAAGRLAEALRAERHPLLHELGRGLQPLPQLRARLETSIDPAGELLDTASPALGGLRRRVRVAYERLRSRLEQLVHGELSSALQEPLITLRNGRYVVPVKAEARGRVKGIVHDQSGSGQTVFVEPLVALEMGNAWREAQLAAQAEEERILDELSALVGAQADALRGTLAALATFDLWSAKAKLAGELRAVRAVTSRGEVDLVEARHPGLSGHVVPISVQLGDEFRAVVITGPNTGGKTVALRTVGLLALMHQAGLHIPAAEGSRLPIFRDVFADIGDEQSIAQSLSTFSGHMRSIVRIVAAAGRGCLVLLDELGAGTDPTEGSALAQALLDHFIRAGALVVATTHYAELKTYAHNNPDARNASVEFDLETLSPTYRLSIGLPGTSQAFAIAERLGLPPALVEEARSRLSRAQQEFESTLASIKAAQGTTRDALERAAEAEVRATEAQRAAEQERARARREREQALAAARAEADRAVEEVRRDVNAARELLARQTLTESRLGDAMTRLEQRLSALGSAPAEPPADSAPPTVPRWRVGMSAATRAGFEGRISAIDSDGRRATLDAGGVRVSVDASDLVVPGTVARERDGRAGAARTERPLAGRRGEFGAAPAAQSTDARSGGAARRASPIAARAVRAVPSSLDLRGARVEEAIEMLDRYLDQAATADAGRVTVIHGHGTGALREAVRALLSGHPLVTEWRPGERGEGGEGATVVTL